MKHAVCILKIQRGECEGDDFCNILMPNDTCLILVKILPNRGMNRGYCSSRLDRITGRVFKINVSDSNKLILFLHKFGPGDHKSGLRTSRSLLVLQMYVESICASAGLTIIYGMYSL
jgi:hypothetical protein